MPSITEGKLHFDFPENWQVTKYDDWAFYKNQFSKLQDGLKAIDILAIDPETTVWFIEIKDYRQHQRTKFTELADEVVLKTLHTLAALLPAGVNANEPEEKTFAQNVLCAKKLRVVLHLEQPGKHSRLTPRAIDPANISQKLRGKLKAIDAHPKVVERQNMQNLVWQVHSV
jgi:hypothetical protein